LDVAGLEVGMRYRSIRFATLAAMLGAVVGLVLTPYMAAAGVFSPGIVWADLSTPFERFFGPLIESSGALTFGDAGAAYRLYGKGFFVVYLLLVPIVRLVHHSYRNAGGTSRVELRSWWVMYVALLAALFGDFVSYWALSIPGDSGEFIAVAGFLIEINAVGLLLLSTAVYGAVAVRFKVLPRWGARLMITVVPVGWATGHYVMGYFPNAWTVPFSVAWGALALWLAVATKRSGGVWPLPIDPQSRPQTTVRAVVQGYWVTGISLLLGVFMVFMGVLLAVPSDGDEGWFGLAYGILGVVSGVTILRVVYLLGSHQMSPSRGRFLMAVGVGLAAIGYFWVVVPVVFGAIVGWFGIHHNRTTTELVHRYATKAPS
jgi:hypothetical protein